jgi:hypothetical protein
MNEPTEKELISQAMRLLGQRKSAKKAKASRENGRKNKKGTK